MPGELELAGLLANALALPKTITGGQQEAQLYQALAEQAEKAGLLAPGQAKQFAPLPPLGRPGTISGAIFNNPVSQTIGSFGQVLQGIVGSAPSAPRPPLTALVQLNRLGRQNEFGKKLQEDIKAGKTPHDIAEDIAPYAPLTAAKMITPPKPGTNIGALIVQRDAEKDPAKRAEIQREIDEQQRLRVQAAEAGGRAGALGREDVTGPKSSFEKALGIMSIPPGERGQLSPGQIKEAQALSDQIEADTARVKSAAIASAKAGSPLQIENLRSSRAILKRARAAAERALKWQEGHPFLGIAVAKTGVSNILLAYAAATGDKDAAFLVNNLPTLMPRIARFLGEIRPTVLEEFRLRGGIGVERKTYQEALATFDEFLSLIDDMTPENIRGQLDQMPRPERPSIPEELQLQATAPGGGVTRGGNRFTVKP